MYVSIYVILDKGSGPRNFDDGNTVFKFLIYIYAL